MNFSKYSHFSEENLTFVQDIQKSGAVKAVQSDYSFIESSRRYCAPESADRIRQDLRGKPREAVHMLGSGDYHYVSLFRAESFRQDFYLSLFDNHSDDQAEAFCEELLSCGGWVRRVRSLDRCKGDVWIRTVRDAGRLDSIPDASAVFLSIDLDVLSPLWADTDWDQGEMSLSELLSEVQGIASRFRLLGADICGRSPSSLEEDSPLNEKARESLMQIFDRL